MIRIALVALAILSELGLDSLHKLMREREWRISTAQYKKENIKVLPSGI